MIDTPPELAEEPDDEVIIPIAADWDSTLRALFRRSAKLAEYTNASPGVQQIMSKVVLGVVRWCKMTKTAIEDVECSLQLTEHGRFVVSIHRRT